MIEAEIAGLEDVYRRCGCVDSAAGKRYGSRCPRLADPEHGSWYFAAPARQGSLTGWRGRFSKQPRQRLLPPAARVSTH